jgi:hypothetical protein
VDRVKVLVLPLVIPAITIALASVLQRRLGHQFGGRLVGLPLTTCPFLLVLLRTEGSTAAADAAAGVAAGQLVIAAFCTFYGRFGHRLRNTVTAIVVTLTFTVGAQAVVAGIGSTPIAAVLVVAIVAVSILTWPPLVVPASTTMSVPRWETPLRVLATTSMIAGLTGAVRVLGTQLAGLLACTPVVLWILALTTHRRCGFPAAATLTRGALCSVPGTLTFALIIAYTLQPFGAAVAFSTAALALLITDHTFRRLVSFAGATKIAVTQQASCARGGARQADAVS